VYNLVTQPLLKLLVFLLRPLIWLTFTSPETCAGYILFALIDANNGMYRRNTKGDEIGMKGFPTLDRDEVKKEDAQKALWEHSLEATTV
jgi:hypothetical protein